MEGGGELTVVKHIRHAKHQDQGHQPQKNHRVLEERERIDYIIPRQSARPLSLSSSNPPDNSDPETTQECHEIIPASSSNEQQDVEKRSIGNRKTTYSVP